MGINKIKQKRMNTDKEIEIVQQSIDLTDKEDDKKELEEIATQTDESLTAKG